MPLWHVHHPVDAYSAEDKRDFTADITELYTSVGLPAFYVVVLFHASDEESFFVGGEPTSDTVRITIEHIARHLEDPDRRAQFTERINKTILRHTVDRTLHCEFHVDETPRDLWMVEGLWPPPSKSDAEKFWVTENRPVPY